MTQKILFLHGFFASGSCVPARLSDIVLREGRRFFLQTCRYIPTKHSTSYATFATKNILP